MDPIDLNIPDEWLVCEFCDFVGHFNEFRAIDGRICCASKECSQKALDDIRPDDEVL